MNVGNVGNVGGGGGGGAERNLPTWSAFCLTYQKMFFLF